MKIEIKNRFTGEVICGGDFDLRDCIVKNKADLRNADLRNAYLRNADLRNANLLDADLWGADLRNADLWGADLRGADLRDADLRGADLRGADLRGANLWGADLRGADLRSIDLWDADLRGADLRGAKNYFNFIDFCIEIIRKQADEFTDEEWLIIGKVCINRWCWKTIRKNYGEKVMPILEKISKSGFDEYEEYYKGLLREVI